MTAHLLLVLLALSPASAPSASEAESLYARASELAARGALAPAVSLLEETITIDTALGDERRLPLARDRASLGLCLSALGRTDDAIAQLRASLAIWREAGARLETISALERLGHVEFAHSRLADAQAHFEEALRLAADDAPDSVPGLLSNVGMVCQARGRDDEALASFERVLAHPGANAAARATALGNLANLHLVAGRLSEAEATYLQARTAFSASGDTRALASTTVNLGMVYTARGRFEEARSAFEEGIAHARREGQALLEASALLHDARVLEAIGLFDQAEASYRRSLELFRGIDQPQNVASASIGLGSLYLAWGRADRALAAADEARVLAERHTLQDQLMASLELTGRAHRSSGSLNAAVLDYERALEIAKRLGRAGDEGRVAGALGLAFLAWRKPRQAEPHLREALAAAERLGHAHAVAQAWIHIGALHDVEEDTARAREAYLRGLELSSASGAAPDQATALNDLGALALRTGDLREAESRLLQAIELEERFRLTARDEDRQSSLVPWLSSYRWLVHLHFLEGDAAAAFDVCERIKARHLAEQIASKAASPETAPSGIDAFRRSLAPGVAVVSFANVDWWHPLAIVATRDAIRMHAVDVPRPASGSEGEEPAVLPGTMRPGVTLGRWLAEYRDLLALRDPRRAQRARREALARQLFDVLLAPAEAILAKTEEVIVIPDGSLSLIPLETLRLPDGRYLVERHHVTYAPSLRVLQLLRERRTQRRHERPLLALGGAPHGGAGSARGADVSPAQLSALRAALRRRLAGGESAADVYAALGARWSDLPGARAEVESIGRLVPRSLVVSGSDVSEATVKRLSKEGRLRQFATLHFATHGLTIPDAPELSALVLAEAGHRDAPGEDGYLSAEEIAELDLDPEFVNLSACESGLGRVFGGEGAVGLTYAFLHAGARGVSVSLWQVHDRFTRDFMVALYAVMKRRGLSPAHALTEVKRSFLRHRHSQPFLWASFVFYGG